MDIVEKEEHDVPEHLLFDILSRLPVKSLLICKCVSKSWCHLISDPCFVQTHLLSSSINAKTESTQLVVIERLHILYIVKNKQLIMSSVQPYSSSPPPWKQRVEFPEYLDMARCSPQNCRGLFSFTTRFRDCESSDKKMFTVVAVNPATRCFRELPKLTPTINEDGYKKALVHGISYIVFDPSSKTYKVLWISMVYSRKNVHGENVLSTTKLVYVINLVNDALWRKVVVPSEADEPICWAFPSLHHPVPKLFNPTLARRQEKSIILVFDAEHETFLTFTFFQPRATGIGNPDLRTATACQGSIYIFCGCDASKTNKLLDVWVMKLGYKLISDQMRVKESSFNLQFLYEGADAERSLWGISIYCVIDHGIVLKIRTGTSDGVYVIYDSVKKGIQRYEIADEELVTSIKKHNGVLQADFYESLVSPKLGY